MNKTLLARLPNALTVARVVAIPFMVLVFYLPVEWGRHAAAWIFFISALTDFLDGYLARELDQSSPFGAFLDPVADKLQVTVGLLLLLQAEPELYILLPTLVLIGREIIISALREWMAQSGQRDTVAVSFIGKAKTVAQLVALIWLIYGTPLLGLPSYEAGVVLLYVSAVLSVWSMVDYLKSAWPSLSSGLKNGDSE